jgi:hypothetical protein
MGFDLNHGRLDPCNGNDLAQLLQRDIRQADRLAPAIVNKTLERLPRLAQRHPWIIDYLTALVPWILLVAGSKGKSDCLVCQASFRLLMIWHGSRRLKAGASRHRLRRLRP